MMAIRVLETQLTILQRFCRLGLGIMEYRKQNHKKWSLSSYLVCRKDSHLGLRKGIEAQRMGGFSCRSRRTRQEACLGSRNQRHRVWWRFGSSIYPILQLDIDHLEKMVLHLLIVVLFTNLMPFRKKWTGFPNELYQELLQPIAQLFQFSSKTWQ